MDDHTSKGGEVVPELNEFDVSFGRGKNAFFRPGNVNFRRLAREKAVAYETTALKTAKGLKTMKDLTYEVLAEIKASGGRFLRPVLAAVPTNGEVVGAWEVVGADLAFVKTKQAIRDARSSGARKKPRKPKGDSACSALVQSNFLSSVDESSRQHATTNGVMDQAVVPWQVHVQNLLGTLSPSSQNFHFAVPPLNCSLSFAPLTGSPIPIMVYAPTDAQQLQLLHYQLGAPNAGTACRPLAASPLLPPTAAIGDTSGLSCTTTVAGNALPSWQLSSGATASASSVDSVRIASSGTVEKPQSLATEELKKDNVHI